MEKEVDEKVEKIDDMLSFLRADISLGLCYFSKINRSNNSSQAHKL